MSGPGPRLAPFTSLAFDSAPAAEATVAIHRVRMELEASFGAAYSIEVLVRPSEEPGALRTRLLAELGPILEAKGVSRRDEGPVFFSVFVGDELHFFQPRGFFGGLDAVAGPAALLP